MEGGLRQRLRGASTPQALVPAQPAPARLVPDDVGAPGGVPSKVVLAGWPVAGPPTAGAVDGPPVPAGVPASPPGGAHGCASPGASEGVATARRRAAAGGLSPPAPDGTGRRHRGPAAGRRARSRAMACCRHLGGVREGAPGKPLIRCRRALAGAPEGPRRRGRASGALAPAPRGRRRTTVGGPAAGALAGRGPAADGWPGPTARRAPRWLHRPRNGVAARGRVAAGLVTDGVSPGTTTGPCGPCPRRRS